MFATSNMAFASTSVRNVEQFYHMSRYAWMQQAAIGDTAIQFVPHIFIRFF